MLGAAEGTIGAVAPHCKLQFVKLDGLSLPREAIGGDCDVITMNSVLHHLPDPGHLLAEVDRILVPGGTLVIWHEPNRRFYTSRAARRRAATLGLIPDPCAAAGRVLRRLRVIDLAREFLGGEFIRRRWMK